MKKKFIFTIIISFMMLIPSLVNAASISVSLSCPESTTQGSTVQCKINVNSDIVITGISGNYSLNGLTYSSIEVQNGFTAYGATTNGFLLGNNSGKSGNFTIAVVNLNLTSAGSITIKNLEVSDTQNGVHQLASSSSSIRLKSTNADLSSLSISSGTLSPIFNANTTDYTATVDATSIVINASKGDNYQTISGTGTKSLKYGTNSFKITVTAESGTTKTYNITITRPDNRSTNNYLSKLTVSEGKLNFNKNTTSYNLNVESDKSSITIGAILEDSKASFVLDYGPRKVNLNYGKNEILIKVKAENESVKIYKIIVNRKDNRSTNNYLKSLSLNKGNISFDKENLEYNTSVEYDINKLEIKAVAEDEKAKVVLENPELLVGENIIKIKVTAENGSEKIYTIKVNRLSEAEKMSDNNNVSSINIFGHKFKFKKDVSKYNIKISKEETELIFDVKLEDEKANYNIKGNKNLKDGSTITVKSISESGIEKEYKFIITKEENKETNNTITYIVISVIYLIAGFILGYYFKNIRNVMRKGTK